MQYDEHKLVEYFADAPAGVGFSDLDLNNIPHHISCIMDGNGRWATSRGLARTEGHKAGIVSLREIITACVRLGVDVLSAYAFSTENWNRPQHEVNVLMHLFAKTFIDELPLLKRENVRVVFLGDISALPKKTRDVFERGLAECADHTGMTLALAVNYGARAEITRAVRQLALDAAAGKIDPAAIDDDIHDCSILGGYLHDADAHRAMMPDTPNNLSFLQRAYRIDFRLLAIQHFRR